MPQIISSLWPLFAMIGCGWVMCRQGFPHEGFWNGAERINYFILFPALLFKSLATASLADSPVLLGFALCAVLVLAVSWGVLLLLRHFFLWEAARFGVFVQATLRFNTYIGLATIGSIFGYSGLQRVSLLVAISVPLVNVLSVLALTSGRRISSGAMAMTLFRNPLILSCLGGLLVNFLGFVPQGGVADFLAMLSATSLPLGLLCVGAALQPRDLWGETPALITSSFVRLLIVPGLAFLLSRLFGLPQMECVVLVLFFGLPSAPSAYILTRQLGGDARLMAGTVTLQTLLSVVTLPVLLQLV